MSPDSASRALLGAAALWAAGALAFQAWRFRGAVRREIAEPRGSALAGAVYGFTAAMSPARKESASRHPLAFGAGILLHLGVAASLSIVFLSAVAPGGWPRLGAALAGVSAVGLAACVGLLVRRLATAPLREMSPPDDYISNLAVALLLASSLAFRLDVLPAAALQLLAALVLLYVPVGKLRHGMFFFLARGDLSLRLGARGVYPPAARKGGGRGVRR